METVKTLCQYRCDVCNRQVDNDDTSRIYSHLLCPNCKTTKPVTLARVVYGPATK